LLADRFLVETANKQSTGDDKLLARLRSALEYEELLIAEAGGTIVSKLIERYLINNSENWILESNGASDYPDLFFRDNDTACFPGSSVGPSKFTGLH